MYQCLLRYAPHLCPWASSFILVIMPKALLMQWGAKAPDLRTDNNQGITGDCNTVSNWVLKEMRAEPWFNRCQIYGYESIILLYKQGDQEPL